MNLIIHSQNISNFLVRSLFLNMVYLFCLQYIVTKLISTEPGQKLPQESRKPKKHLHWRRKFMVVFIMATYSTQAASGQNYNGEKTNCCANQHSMFDQYFYMYWKKMTYIKNSLFSEKRRATFHVLTWYIQLQNLMRLRRQLIVGSALNKPHQE